MLPLALVALVGVPGPDSTAIAAAARDPDSLRIAAAYAAARGVPARQLCPLDVPLTEQVSLADFTAQIAAPLRRCLEDAGVRERIEAVVLTRGLPLRVVVPLPGGSARVSLAAALALGDTATSTGAPLLGRSPGRSVPCGAGVTCFGARWINPYRAGVFRAGWTTRQNGFTWRPLIVTMLHGRTADDALRLVASATTAEAQGGARGTFLFMEGADPARGALDSSFDAVIAQLRALGFTDVARAPFAADRTGQTLAALFVGTAGLGTTVEGNAYAPGALVDNLTSFGAVPENFRPTGEEVQVSIARWVARGVAGVHGTTDEPLNDCFPARTLIVSYAEGGTLGEAYFRALPYAYWQNLVLGDPMAAPYAVRPRVIVEGVADGEAVAGARRVRAHAEDPLGRTVDHLALYADGALLLDSGGDPMDVCVPAGVRHLLAVAQVADERTPQTQHAPKGWTSLRVTPGPGPASCDAPDAGALASDAASDADAAGATADAATADAAAPAADDAALADAGAPRGADATGAVIDDAGCACSSGDRRADRASTVLAVALWGALGWAFRRRRVTRR